MFMLSFKNASSVLALTSSQAFHSAPHFFFQNNDSFQLKDKGVLDMCQVEFIMAVIGGERNFTTFPSFDADTSSSWFGYLVNNASLSLCLCVWHMCTHSCPNTFSCDSAIWFCSWKNWIPTHLKAWGQLAYWLYVFFACPFKCAH